LSLPLKLQLRVYELLACKRMTGEARAVAQQRFVGAYSEGRVRLLIADLEKLPDMNAEDKDDAWSDIEDEMDKLWRDLGTIQ
jgi:hypothetical protein